jgi:hypothetical protein
VRLIVAIVKISGWKIGGFYLKKKFDGTAFAWFVETFCCRNLKE